jgi:hypothetical protein
VSLLAPNLRVYNSAHTQLYTGSGSGYTGSTVSYTRAASANQTYFIRVDGANTTSFGTGAYVLAVKFGTAALPPVTPPNTQTVNGDPLSAGGWNPDTIGPGTGGHDEENEAFDSFSASSSAHGHAWASAGQPGQTENLAEGVWAALQGERRTVRDVEDTRGSFANADPGLGKLRTTLSQDTRSSALEDNKDTSSDGVVDASTEMPGDAWFVSIDWMRDLLSALTD